MNAGKVDQPLETRHPGMRDARERECVVPDEPEPRADRSVTRHLDLDAIDRSPRIDRPARDLRRAVTCDVVEGAERLQVRPVVDACRRGWLSTGWPGAVSAGAAAACAHENGDAGQDGQGCRPDASFRAVALAARPR